MRVMVGGSSESVAVLRGYLRKAGDVAIWKDEDAGDPDYTIRLEEVEDRRSKEIYFNSIDCELEQAIMRHVRQKASLPIVLCSDGGAQSDRIIHIVFPASQAQAIELGVQMGFADFAGPQGDSLDDLYRRLDKAMAEIEALKRRSSWWQFWKRGAVVVLAGLFLALPGLRSQDPAPPLPPPNLPMPLEPAERERLKDLWVEGFLALARVEDSSLAVERYMRQAAEARADNGKRQKELDEVNNKIAAMIGGFRDKYKAGMDRWCLTRQLAWVSKVGDKPCPAIFSDDTTQPPR